jgi:hypothetical protein
MQMQPAAQVRRLCALSLAALVGVALPATAAAEQLPEVRIERLEAQVRALTERIAALEAEQSPAAPGEIAWQLDQDLNGRTFRVVHQALDADDGRVELLLQVAAPVPVPEHWMQGSPAPIRLTLRAADGSEQGLYMTLIRGASVEPGKHLHLLAELDPAIAAATSLILIEYAD